MKALMLVSAAGEIIMQYRFLPWRVREKRSSPLLSFDESWRLRALKGELYVLGGKIAVEMWRLMPGGMSRLNASVALSALVGLSEGASLSIL